MEDKNIVPLLINNSTACKIDYSNPTDPSILFKNLPPIKLSAFNQRINALPYLLKSDRGKLKRLSLKVDDTNRE